ncbi:MAG: hypothetical protein EPO21_01520 [Chloroflexota bacterium]|nr:MAG: hypothetical protein EPO21_01520 [Chloroflexota bacterium]
MFVLDSLVHSVDPAWSAVPIGAGVVGLGIRAGTHFFQRKSNRDAQLPPGASALATNDLNWEILLPDGRAIRSQRQSKGRLTLVLVGTYGVRQGLRLIRAFQRGGRLEDIGVVIVVELDERERALFSAKLHPALKRRTVFCPSTVLPGGLQNRTVEEVEAPNLRQYWQPAVANTVEDGCRLIRSTEHTVSDPGESFPQQGYDPAVILVVASPGGHTAVGIFASRLLQTNFPLASTYVVTVVPDDHLRAEFARGIERYCQAGFVRWFLVTDNQRSLLANDYSVGILPASLWVAPLLADAADEPWNVLVRLYPRGSNGVIVPRYWGRMLPVHRTRANPPRLFTFREAAYRAVLEGLEAIEAEETKGIHLRTPAQETARYVVITLPLEPHALLEVKDLVDEALRAKGWFEVDRFRHLVWATLAEPVDSGVTSVPMSVVMVEAAIDGVSDLKTLCSPNHLVVSLPGDVERHPHGGTRRSNGRVATRGAS